MCMLYSPKAITLLLLLTLSAATVVFATPKTEGRIARPKHTFEGRRNLLGWGRTETAPLDGRVTNEPAEGARVRDDELSARAPEVLGTHGRSLSQYVRPREAVPDKKVAARRPRDETELRIREVNPLETSGRHLLGARVAVDRRRPTETVDRPREPEASARDDVGVRVRGVNPLEPTGRHLLSARDPADARITNRRPSDLEASARDDAELRVTGVDPPEASGRHLLGSYGRIQSARDAEARVVAPSVSARGRIETNGNGRHLLVGWNSGPAHADKKVAMAGGRHLLIGCNSNHDQTEVDKKVAKEDGARHLLVSWNSGRVGKKAVAVPREKATLGGRHLLSTYSPAEGRLDGRVTNAYARVTDPASLKQKDCNGVNCRRLQGWLWSGDTVQRPRDAATHVARPIAVRTREPTKLMP